MHNILNCTLNVYVCVHLYRFARIVVCVLNVVTFLPASQPHAELGGTMVLQHPIDTTHQVSGQDLTFMLRGGDHSILTPQKQALAAQRITMPYCRHN